MVSGSRRVGRLKARTKVQSDARAAIATKAVAYVRVSTEEQAATGHGLETQDKAVRAFAESQGYQLVEVAADPGVSGATKPADRPGFGRVLELAAAGAFTVLLVYKFDRLAREIRYAVTTVSDLAEQHDVMIRSVTEPIDTATPMGRTLFAILAGMTDLATGASVDVTVNDRGPHPRLHRALDLSKGAAARLGILHRGVIRARLTLLTTAGLGRLHLAGAP